MLVLGPRGRTGCAPPGRLAERGDVVDRSIYQGAQRFWGPGRMSQHRAALMRSHQSDSEVARIGVVGEIAAATHYPQSVPEQR